MASQCILYNSDDLAKTAQAYHEAANGFAAAKSTFVQTGASNPGFGLFMMALYPPYIACKAATQGYLGNIGQMAEKLSTALQGASEDSQQVECDCQDQIDNLQKQIDEHNKRLTALENNQHTGTSTDSNMGDGGEAGTGSGGYGGGGGYSGGGGTGGYSGGGGGGSADSSDTSGMQGISTPAQSSPADTSTSVDDGAQTSYAPIDTANGTGAGTQHGAGTTDTQHGTDSNTQNGTGTNGTMPPADQKTKDTVNTIGLDANGDAKDDYSLNLADGNTHATALEDGSVKLSRQDASSMPMPPGTNAGKPDSSFSIDANNDGKDDVSMAPDTGADARISIFEKDDSKYAAIDFDNDGDYDAAVRIGDSEAAREAIRRETEESVWQGIASRDPLGRSADELKSLYQDRDIVELPQRTEIK
ncbi:hypothetical protein [Bifidobacterium moukalabense]|uniref:hypothetical protein n=1 Tax=Bifidobacterium moukalabense TaxID=1333651 RepID=UPI0010F87C11|nr:hypothetical protein [Bifidobacterium moukalabense]